MTVSQSYLPTNPLHIPRESDADSFMTEAAAALFLDISARTLQQLRWKGGGPEYVKVGRSVRYQRRALIDWMTARARRNTSE